MTISHNGLLFWATLYIAPADERLRRYIVNRWTFDWPALGAGWCR